jgi:hypothetical protein
LRWRRRTGGLLLPIAARHVDLDERGPVAIPERTAAPAEAANCRLLYVVAPAPEAVRQYGARRRTGREMRSCAGRKPSRGTALSALWAAIEVDLPPPTASVVPGATPSSASSGVPLLRLPLDWRPPPLPPALPIASRVAAADEQVVEFDWVHETARQIGIVAHRLLRQCADEGLDRWPSERISLNARVFASSQV